MVLLLAYLPNKLLSSISVQFLPRLATNSVLQGGFPPIAAAAMCCRAGLLAAVGRGECKGEGRGEGIEAKPG